MKYIYACHNTNCAKKEGRIFRLEIPCEAIIDEKNVAKLFCQKCGNGLIIEQQIFE